MARVFVRTFSGFFCAEGFSFVPSSVPSAHGFSAFAGRQPVVLQRLYLPSAHILLSESRSYRKTRKLSPLTTEEQFILRLLETQGFGNVTVGELKTFAVRLSYLVTLGCKPYELVEYPKILLLNESEIDQRVEKLRRATDVDGISIILLKYARADWQNFVVKRHVAGYLQRLGGYINKVDEVVEELQCSDTVMMDILTRNPRLLGRQYRKDLAEKIRCLISSGARLDDLYRNTNVLNNKILATIKSRAERLSRIGWMPLPVALIGREDDVFDSILRPFEEQSNSTECIASINDVIRQLPSMSANRITAIRPRIKYLLSEGYTVSDIIKCPQALSRSVKGLKMAISELKPYHLQCVDLAIITHYVKSRCILSSRRCNIHFVIARVLGCSRSLLPPLPKDSSIRAVQDIENKALVNAKYLRDELGFTTEDLASVPVILVHTPDIVRRHWNILNSVDDKVGLFYGSRRARALFQQHADNRRLRLNLLQYCIEKEDNFNHAVVSVWTEDSDTEFSVTESLSSVAEADSDSCGDELIVYDYEAANELQIVYESDTNDDDIDPLTV